MRTTPELDAHTGLEKLATYPYQVATWVDETGYPVSVAVEAAIDPAAGTARFVAPAGVAMPNTGDISLTGSHIRPQPGYGYDERRHVTVWGPAVVTAGSVTVRGHTAWGWDEAEVPFFEYSERSVGKSRKYFDALSAERGTPVKPRLSLGFLTLRSTRLPFLTATLVPVTLGILIAARQGSFDLVAALLTIVSACFVHLGLNVSNDVFDTIQGADDANVTPTQFSGGSRVIQYGLVTLRQMAALSAVFYVMAGVLGLVLLATRGSTALLLIGVVGIVVSLGYTAPPLKFVYRGLGEIAVALGFGPFMLVGAYVVQTRGGLSWEPFAASIPVALLVALILYVNEIPDRRGDSHAGKRTLPVRFSRRAVIAGYNLAAAGAYAAIVAAVVAGVLPVPAVLMLLTIPLALQVSRGLEPNYDNPYGLMAVMGVNVRLHLAAGLALLAGYAIVLVAGAVAPGVNLFIG
ncbi:MAG TPA: prenyltransferase [Candidatus Limnocylindrales bacterium]|nr:prenyltransferase [Candidatus Limnocylindrales bacterium]